MNEILPHTNSISEVIYKLQTNIWDRSTKLNFKYEGNWVETTCGRILIYDISGILINYDLDKPGIDKLILEINKKHSNEKAAEIIANLNIEFSHQATKFGLSLCISDLKKSPYQQELLETAKKESIVESGIERSKISDKYINLAVDDWIKNVDKNNSLYLMMVSGARVNKSQIRQMIISKGLLVKMDGNITENAIFTGLTEGLTTHDYFQTCSPARRGLANNFFIVPSSGYFERQLVNLTRDYIVKGEDCKTKNYITIKAKHALGRFFINSRGHEDVVTKTNVNPEEIIQVRSPLTCIQHNGLCQKCCGLDISKFIKEETDFKNMYQKGFGIGVVAAQTLVEPATQLGLRSKHTSGSTTIKDYENRIENTLGLIMKAVGSPLSMYIKIDSGVGETYKTVQGGDYLEKSSNLCDYIHNLYVSSGISINRIWVEIVVRGMSEIQKDPINNKLFMRMDKPYIQFDFDINSVFWSLRNSPSFDKRNQFGYAKQNIIDFLTSEKSKDIELHSEKLMYGNLVKGKFNLK